MVSVIALAAVFAADVIIKGRIERRYSYKDEKKVLGGAVTIRRSSNKGAFLGLFKKYKAALKIAAGIITLAVAALYVAAFVKKRGAKRKMGLALILAGALSNEYDRIKKGSVTDYVSINLPLIKRLVFNLGDFSIFAGIIVLLFDN